MKNKKIKIPKELWAIEHPGTFMNPTFYERFLGKTSLTNPWESTGKDIEYRNLCLASINPQNHEYWFLLGTVLTNLHSAYIAITHHEASFYDDDFSRIKRTHDRLTDIQLHPLKYNFRDIDETIFIFIMTTMLSKSKIQL